MKHCLGKIVNYSIKDIPLRSLRPRFPSLLPKRASTLGTVLILSAVLSLYGNAQDQGSIAGDMTNPSSAPSLMAQMFAAFSSGHSVASVELKGSATWHGGSLDDDGTVTLSATSAGSGQVQLSLNKKGSWIETQVPVTSNCIVPASNSAATMSAENPSECLRPLVWFLPQISLQPKALAPGVVVSDLGLGKVGTISSNQYRHVRSEWAFMDTSDSLALQMTKDEAIDIGLDPQLFLPMVMSYRVHPDNGAQNIFIPIEIHFSNYQKIGGVEIPFVIQRYVNGSLQLEIKVDTALIN